MEASSKLNFRDCTDSGSASKLVAIHRARFGVSAFCVVHWSRFPLQDVPEPHRTRISRMLPSWYQNVPAKKSSVQRTPVHPPAYELSWTTAILSHRAAESFSLPGCTCTSSSVRTQPYGATPRRTVVPSQGHGYIYNTPFLPQGLTSLGRLWATIHSSFSSQVVDSPGSFSFVTRNGTEQHGRALQAFKQCPVATIEISELQDTSPTCVRGEFARHGNTLVRGARTRH